MAAAMELKPVEFEVKHNMVSSLLAYTPGFKLSRIWDIRFISRYHIFMVDLQNWPLEVSTAGCE